MKSPSTLIGQFESVSIRYSQMLESLFWVLPSVLFVSPRSLFFMAVVKTLVKIFDNQLKPL